MFKIKGQRACGMVRISSNYLEPKNRVLYLKT
jgi:hypothetical protein